MHELYIFLYLHICDRQTISSYHDHCDANKILPLDQKDEQGTSVFFVIFFFFAIAQLLYRDDRNQHAASFFLDQIYTTRNIECNLYIHVFVEYRGAIPAVVKEYPFAYSNFCKYKVRSRPATSILLLDESSYSPAMMADDFISIGRNE